MGEVYIERFENFKIGRLTKLVRYTTVEKDVRLENYQPSV
jgi:hypothetical protein